MVGGEVERDDGFLLFCINSEYRSLSVSTCFELWRAKSRARLQLEVPTPLH